MIDTCEWCGEHFEPKVRGGHVKRYCSKVCGGMHRRAKNADREAPPLTFKEAFIAAHHDLNRRFQYRQRMGSR